MIRSAPPCLLSACRGEAQATRGSPIDGGKRSPVLHKSDNGMTHNTPDLFADVEHVEVRPRYTLRRKLRVLHVIRPERRRASEHLRLLLTHLDRTRFEPEVAFSPLDEPEFPDQMRRLDVPMHTVEMHRRFTPDEDLKTFHELMKVIRGGRFDVLHLHGRKCALVGRVPGRLTNVRAVVHTPHDFGFQYAHTDRARKFHTRLERTLGRFTDAMICASETEAEEALRMRLVAPERIYTIPDGVDFDELPDRVDHIDVRRRLHISMATRLVVMTGRLDPPMDPGTLLRAARHVLRVQPTTRFVVAGEGELLDFSRHLTRQLQIDRKVLCTGHRADATDIAAVAQINVFSASHGAPPLSLLKSMGLGRPFIASDIEGCREVITHGKTGVLFPASDERILAGAILKLIGDRGLSLRLGTSAREYIRRAHDIRTWSRAIEEVYLKTLAEAARK